jgi:hypothetical protein
VLVNGKKIAVTPGQNGYYPVTGIFKKGDKITIVTPMSLYAESMPDNKSRIAFKYGPIVLAGLLGDSMPDPVYGTPVLLTNERDPGKLMQKSGQELVFHTTGIGRPFDVTLKPFYKVYKEYYSVYWDYFSEADWTAKQQEYEDEKKAAKILEEKTIDNFRIGEMQPERDHSLTASERSYVDVAIGRKGREARTGHHFQFTMKVDPAIENALVLSYIGDDKDRKFDIIVDGKKLATQEWKGGQTGKFYDVAYPLPLEYTKDKESIVVRVEANYGKTAGRVFGVRTIRK